MKKLRRFRTEAMIGLTMVMCAAWLVTVVRIATSQVDKKNLTEYILSTMNVLYAEMGRSLPPDDPKRIHLETTLSRVQRIIRSQMPLDAYPATNITRELVTESYVSPTRAWFDYLTERADGKHTLTSTNTSGVSVVWDVSARTWSTNTSAIIGDVSFANSAEDADRSTVLTGAVYRAVYYTEPPMTFTNASATQSPDGGKLIFRSNSYTVSEDNEWWGIHGAYYPSSEPYPHPLGLSDEPDEPKLKSNARRRD